MRRIIAILALLLCVCVGQAIAQGLVAFDHIERNIKSAQAVAPLKSDLFGDRVSLFNGATEFEVVDIEIPGNNELPVRLGRRMSVGVFGTASLSSGGFSQNPERIAGFERWEISVPYLRGTFDQAYGWNVGGSNQRCSLRGVPRVTTEVSIQDIWSGVHLFIPGEGEQEVSPIDAVHARPSDGHNYVWGTRDLYRARCLPQVTGMTGEGFEFVSPQGLRYRFDVALTVPGGVIGRNGVTVMRETVYLMASRVTDRFGNYVNYNYSGGRLQSITASDGRSISITWDQARVVSATAAGRTWHYSYSGPFRVTNPDGSTWEYQYNGATMVQFQSLDMNACYYPIAEATPYSITAKHPSGAVGQFNFAYLGHVISGTPAQWFCIVEAIVDGEVIGAIGTPDFFSNYGLVSKVITGPGLPPLQWSYEYGQPETGKANFGGPYCTFCDKDKPVRVIQPDGSAEEYQFGALWGFNSGQLLAKYVYAASGSLAGAEIYTHVSDGEMAGMPFPDMHGGFSASNDSSSLRQRPVRTTEIRQNGVVPPHPTYNAISTTTVGECRFSPLRSETTQCVAVGDRANKVQRNIPNEGRLFLDPQALIAASGTTGLLSTPPGTGGNLPPQPAPGSGQSYDSFVSTVETFDRFARPVRTRRTGPNGGQRVDTREYYDSLAIWRLGQPASSTHQASGIVEWRVTYQGSLPHQIYHFGQLRQTLSHNTDGTLATVTDGNGNVTAFGSWKRGIPRSIRYPATPEASSGAAQTAEVNDSGWITSVTDEAGFTTSYGYDPMGRLALIDYPDGDSVGWHNTLLVFEPVASAEYGIAAGHWRQTISIGNGRKVSYFDALWRPLLVREYDAMDATGTQRFSRFTYDHEGRVTFASYPGGGDALTTGTWKWYDALGRPAQVTQDSELGPLTTSTRYLLGFRAEVTPPRGQDAGDTFQTITSYLAWDQPTTDFPIHIKHPAGAFTDIGRDVLGQPISITRRNGTGSVSLTRNYVYGSDRLLCKSVEPETGATIMAYDNVGNLVWSKSGTTLSDIASCNTADVPAAERTVRTYDGRNWLRTLSFPDGRGNQSWTYTRDGLPATINTQNSSSGDVVTNTYNYNQRRLLEGETFSVGNQLWAVGYNYNQNGHLAGYTSPGVAVALSPNALGQPTKAGTYATAVSHYPNGAIKQFTYGNGIKHTLSQNARGLPLTSCDFAGSSCTAAAVLRDSYDYDQHGNVAAISDGRTGSRGHRDMTYDALDRLTQAASPMFGTASYTYSVLDNLQTVQVTGGPKARNHTYVYDARNLLSNVTNTSGGATVTGLGYDAQGNLSNKNGVAYQFDHGNRLRQGGSEQYRYDGHGRRVLSTRAGRNIYSLYGQDGTLRFQRDEHTGKDTDYVHLGGSLVAQVENAIALSTPTLTVPASSTTGSFTVSWGSVAIATRYQVEERLDGGSWTTVHDAAGNSKSISGKAAGAWSYRVRGCSPAACGSWSGVKTVTVQLPPTGVPTLTVPASSTSGSYTVSWTAVAAAATYQLQESVNGGSYITIQDAIGSSMAVTGRQSGAWSYQVRACNPSGCGTYSGAKIIQVTLPPASVPTVTAPATNATGSFTVSWSSVTSATRYELEEQLASGAWTKVHDATTTSKAISGKASGSWGYRARGCNGSACGAWSAIATTVVTLPPDAAPTLTVPSTNSTGSYSVGWSAVSAATRYELEERVGSGSWSQLQNTAATSRSITGKTTGSWGYRVRACNNGGCSAYSAIASVAVTLPPTGTPTLTVPGTGLNGGYTVSWTAVSAAATYQLQERLGSGGWSTVHDAAGTSKAISGKAAGSWSYQVRACNAGGCAAWSAAGTVSVVHPPASAPTLTVPATNLTGSFTASWTSVAAAERYELEERLGSGAWTQVHNAAATSKALSGKTTGSWGYRVRACNVAGCSAYTAASAVEVTRPPTAAPTITAPASSTTGSYGVSWTAVAAATSYELQERHGSGGWTTIQATSGTSRAISGKVGGPWMYRVRACNASGCASWSIEVSVLVVPGAPTITGASNHMYYWGQTAQTSCQVAWTGVTAATRFELASPAGMGMYSGPDTSYLGNAPLCSVLYQVRACNAAGCSAWSPPVEPSFTADPPPPTPDPGGPPMDPLRVKPSHDHREPGA